MLEYIVFGFVLGCLFMIPVGILTHLVWRVLSHGNGNDDC